MVGELGGPEEVVAAGDGVDGADEHLSADLHHPLPRHRDPPVVGAVVDHEQLQGNFRILIREWNSVPKTFLKYLFSAKEVGKSNYRMRILLIFHFVEKCVLLTCTSNEWYATMRPSKTTVETEMRVFRAVE